MVHVAQHYYRSIIGPWLVWNPRAPSFWQEGIADYVCSKLDTNNNWGCAECTFVSAHYRDGYSCAASFLDYLEKTYQQGIVPRLNAALRQGKYTEEFFARSTGKGLSALWAEFQKTPAFTSGAARMLELQASLGFVDGKAPKDVEQRIQSYLSENADELTRRLIDDDFTPGQVKKDPKRKLVLIMYYTQPGGTAEACIVRLQESKKLPGFRDGEPGTLTGFISPLTLKTGFPMTRSFTAIKEGDASSYHYTLLRVTENGQWQLQRAWRTTADGHIADEYPLVQ
jgi:hypothetical protein